MEPVPTLLDRLIAAREAFAAAHEYQQPVSRPGASVDRIREFESLRGITLPPSYHAFLRAHDGVDRLYGDFSFVGTSGEENVRLYNRIQLMVWMDTDETDPVLVTDEDIHEYESQGQYYLPHHLVVGTNMGREMILFDANTRDTEGEMQIVIWRPDEFPHPQHAGLGAFLQWALEDLRNQ